MINSRIPNVFNLLTLLLSNIIYIFVSKNLQRSFRCFTVHKKMCDFRSKRKGGFVQRFEGLLVAEIGTEFWKTRTNTIFLYFFDVSGFFCEVVFPEFLQKSSQTLVKCKIKSKLFFLPFHLFISFKAKQSFSWQYFNFFSNWFFSRGKQKLCFKININKLGKKILLWVAFSRALSIAAQSAMGKHSAGVWKINPAAHPVQRSVGVICSTGCMPGRLGMKTGSMSNGWRLTSPLFFPLSSAPECYFPWSWKIQ